MQFNQYTYKRPDMDSLINNFNDLLTDFENAQNADEQNIIIARLNQLRSNFDTMWNIAHIRHTINTKDEFYEKENTFFDQNLPVFQDLVSKFYRKLVSSLYKNDLKNKWGEQFFSIAELTVKVFESEIVEDLKEENKLVSEYIKLKSSAKIDFEGEERNLSGLAPFMQAEDRSIREKSSDAFWGFFDENDEKFDEIFDKLVKTRHRIAQKLGYDNFVQVGYNRMLRAYSPEEVAEFRRLVKKHIVPVAAELRERQQKRLGLDEFKHYDLGFHFKTGNATPKGDPKWIVNNGEQMYKELSPETDEFFKHMLDQNLMDLVNKKGKAGGGYCTYLADYGSPFIFSNFNGTSHDIDVLTHEAGHAFQVYESRHFEIPEYNWPTYEACEIHSMSMEFFTWPWMDKFFKEDTQKYKFAHLSGALLFLPYGVAVDEFQHWIYENHDATPQQRKKAWRDIEKNYLPWIDYDNCEFLENGGFWQKQAHIYELPFYYIDYTLAQVCAFQFWKKSQNNRTEAFKDYLKLCRAGGSQSFLDLVKFANLLSPFEEGSITEVLGDVKAYLNSVEDTKL